MGHRTVQSGIGRWEQAFSSLTDEAQTARPSSSKHRRRSSLTQAMTTAAVHEALEALLALRDDHGAITAADVADAVLAHDLDEPEAEALAVELDAHGAAPEPEEDEPELDLSVGTSLYT